MWAVSRTAQVLAAIPEICPPVFERSEANKARLPRIVEAFQCAVSAGEVDMTNIGREVGEEIRVALSEIADSDPHWSTPRAPSPSSLTPTWPSSEVSRSMINEAGDDERLDAQLELMTTVIDKKESQLESYWSRLIFSGKGKPPAADTLSWSDSVLPNTAPGRDPVLLPGAGDAVLAHRQIVGDQDGHEGHRDHEHRNDVGDRPLTRTNQLVEHPDR